MLRAEPVRRDNRKRRTIRKPEPERKAPVRTSDPSPEKDDSGSGYSTEPPKKEKPDTGAGFSTEPPKKTKPGSK